MLKLRRFHVANAGWKSAFFEGDTLWFTDPEMDLPVDTVLNAANGNGKTSALALFFSCFDTELWRFMRTLANKNERFEDYFQTGEPALLVAEWTDGARRAVTGQIITQRADGLERIFFAFWGDARFGMDDLPFPGLGCGRDERMRTRDQVLRWLRETVAARQNSHEFWRTEKQGEWKQRLPSFGIDPQLLAWMVDLNKEEGGITNFLKFTSERAFVARFLEMAVPQTLANEARENMRAGVQELAGSVKSKEGLNAAEQLLFKASAFAETAGRFSLASAAARAARARQAGLRSALSARKIHLEDEKREAERSRDALRERISEATERREAAATSLAAAEVALARADSEDANARAQAALEETKKAKLRRSVLAAGEAHAKILRKEAEVSALEEQLAAASRGLEEPERNARRAGDAYAAALDAAVARSASAKQEADRVVRDATEEVTAAKRRIEASRDVIDVKHKLVGKLEGDIQNVAAERHRAVANGAMSAEENAGAAKVRLETEIGQAQAEADQAARRAGALAAEAHEHANAVGLQRGKAAEFRSSRDGAQARLEEARSARSAISTLPIVTELLGDEGFDPESPAVVRALRSEEQRCREALRSNEARVRTLEADRRSIERYGLAAVDESLRTVVEHLRGKSIGDAMPYAVWLAGQNVPAAEIRRMSAADPALVSGVWVPDAASLEKARALVGPDLGLERPVMVRAGGPGKSDAATDNPVVFPVARTEAYDPRAAKLTLANVQAVIAKLNDETIGFGERIDQCDRAVRDIDAWVRKWGGGAVENIRNAMRQAAAELERTETAIAEHEEHRDACLKAEKEELARAEGARQRVMAADRKLVTVTRFIAEFEQKLPGLRQALGKAEADLEAGKSALSEADHSHEEWRKRLADGQEGSKNANREIGEHSGHLRGIRYRGGDGVHRTDLSLEQAKAHCEQAANTLDDLRNGEAALLSRSLQAKTKELAEEHLLFNVSHGEVYRANQEAVQEAANLDNLPDASRRASDEVDRLSSVSGEFEGLAKVARETFRKSVSALYEQAKALFEKLVSKQRQQLVDMAETARTEHAEAERTIGEDSLMLAGAESRLNGIEASLLTVSALASGIPESSVSPEPIELEADADRLTAQVSQANSEAQSASARENAARLEAEKSHRAMRELAASQRVADANAVLSQNIQGWSFETAANQPQLIIQVLEQIIAGYRHQIAKYKEHQELVVTSLERLVQSAIGQLRRACNFGIVPMSVPRMGGRAILKPGLDLAKVSAEVRRNVINRWLEVQIQEQRIPERGHDIAAELLHEIVASQAKESLGLRILKPTDAGDLDWVPVAEMKASGGETLTAALLLWVVLTKLRAESETSSRVSSGGALILDNPIGKANHQLFLQTQRALAAAMGVQLIFTTGVDDLQALGEFPHVLKFGKSGMRKDRVLVRVAAERLGEPRHVSRVERGLQGDMLGDAA